MASIDEIMARLSKDTLKKVRLGSDISKDYIPSPSFGINLITGGGFPIGKQTTLWGNESAGKSALATQTAGIAQKQGRGVGYIDVEKTFDPDWARRLGCDPDALIITQVSSIADYTDVCNDMIKAGVEMIILDSSSALMPGSFYKEGELKDFENTGQIGQQARELGQAGRMIQGTNFSCAMVHISQVRMDLGGFRPTMKPSGGKEVGHGDSLRIRLSSSTSSDKAIKETINGFEEVVGREVTWQINKNKVNGRFGDGKYGLYTRGDFVGVDRFVELAEYGKRYGIIEGTTWLTIYGEKMQGMKNMVQYLKDNPEISEKLEQEIVTKAA